MQKNIAQIAYVIIKELDQNRFLENAKAAFMKLIHEKNERNKVSQSNLFR